MRNFLFIPDGFWHFTEGNEKRTSICSEQCSRKCILTRALQREPHWRRGLLQIRQYSEDSSLKHFPMDSQIFVQFHPVPLTARLKSLDNSWTHIYIYARQQSFSSFLSSATNRWPVIYSVWIHKKVMFLSNAREGLVYSEFQKRLMW